MNRFLFSCLLLGACSAHADPLPAKVEKVDALELRLSSSELLRAQAAVEKLQEERRVLVARFAAKYQVDPDHDRIDLDSLTIQRAPKAVPAPPVKKK